MKLEARPAVPYFESSARRTCRETTTVPDPSIPVGAAVSR
jgi:hypothetical protein